MLNRINWHNTFDEYQAEVRRAVMHEQLVPRSSATLLPLPSAIGELLLDYFVTLENFMSLAARFEIGVKVAEAVPEPQAKPVETEGASGGVVAAKAEPLPLTTGDIAFCFAGLRWRTEEEWKKPLGDKPRWLSACISIPGVQGVSETRWNPVLIGAALVNKGHSKPNSIRAKFQTMPQLAAWLEIWKTYEADYFDMN